MMNEVSPSSITARPEEAAGPESKRVKTELAAPPELKTGTVEVVAAPDVKAEVKAEVAAAPAPKTEASAPPEGAVAATKPDGVALAELGLAAGRRVEVSWEVEMTDGSEVRHPTTSQLTPLPPPSRLALSLPLNLVLTLALTLTLTRSPCGGAPHSACPLEAPEQETTLPQPERRER